MEKLLVIVTINDVEYELVPKIKDNKIYLSAIEEYPLYQLEKFGDIWNIKGYNINHNIEFIPEYRVTFSILDENLPIEFTLRKHKLKIIKIKCRGGEGIIYEGMMDGIDIIFRVQYRNIYKFNDQEKQRFYKFIDLSLEVSKYTPRKLLYFIDDKEKIVLCMEKMYPLIYSKHILNQAIDFLKTLKHNNIVHGDISPGNLLMDKEGNLKVIDFSDMSTKKRTDGTKFYSKFNTDSQAMARSLLYIKYKNHIKHLTKFLVDNIKNLRTSKRKRLNEVKEKLESYKNIYFIDLYWMYDLYFKYRVDENDLLTWFGTQIPNTENNAILLNMAKK